MKTTTRKPAAKKAAPPAKRKPGRPTHYRPEYCDIVVELGEQGKSLAQMGAACGVARITLHEWAEKYEAFAEALTRARDLSMAWWESKAQSHFIEEHQGPRINPSVWSRSMAARFPDDYRESKELVGAGGNPLIPPNTMTETERAARVAALLELAAKRDKEQSADDSGNGS